MADYAIHDTTLISQADILRKKFGTNDRQDPADYAYKMNLMGLLEEKTVSGAIASFSDGADDVPLKKFEVNIDPNLDGVSSVGVVHCGKNFIDDRLSNIEQGSIDGSNGNNTSATSRVRNSTMYRFPFDKLYSNYTLTRPTGYKIAMRFYDSNGDYVYLGSSATIFLASLPSAGVGKDIQYARFVFAKTDDSNITPEDIKNIGYQLEYGSTATAYAPYVTPTTHTANLGRTIYGGSVDVVNGTGTKTYEKKLGSELTWGRHNSGNYFYCTEIASEKASGQTNVIAEDLTTTTTSAMPSTDYSISGRTADGAIFVRLTGAETKEQFEEWIANKVIVFEKATPEDFTFDPVPINSFLGDNTLWADTGDISDCTYRGQGTTTPTVLITKSITADGTYNASDDNADGYSQVVVNVTPPAPVVTDLIPTPATSSSTEPFANNYAYSSPAWQAFDKSTATAWISGSGSNEKIIGWKFASAVVVNRVTLTNGDDPSWAVNQSPACWAVEGSNDDGTTWTMVSSSGHVWTSLVETATHDFTNSTGYKWWRIRILKSMQTYMDYILLKEVGFYNVS